MGFPFFPKWIFHPLLKSIGDTADRAVRITGFERVRFEKTRTREPYGSRSSPMVRVREDRVSTSAGATRPEKGSHHSGCNPETRKVAFAFWRALDVLARK